MSWNDLCSSLIVIGSYAPGQANHGCFADLPGRWIKGVIVADLVDPPDGIRAEERESIEAWVIHFEDCGAEMFTDEWREEEQMLEERWAELDRRMGARWGRETFRWWPEGVETVPGCPGMIAVNMYVPIEHFSYLEYRPDTPAPDESLAEQWRRVRCGEAEYDSSSFLGLLKDAGEAEAEELFGELPSGPEFVGKWRRVVRDHSASSGGVLSLPEEGFSLYVQPLVRNALGAEALVALADRDRAQRVALLRAAGDEELAEALAALEVVWGGAESGSDGDWVADDHPASEALERIDDYLLEISPRDHWYYCLLEAAYGVAADFRLRDWLMATWLDLPVDLEPSYLLWRAGGRVRVVDGRYRVTEVERRG